MITIINCRDSKYSENMLPMTLLLWVVAVVLLFYKLGDTTLWQSEDRWLEVASEMVRSDNFFRPTINGVVYFDKPLLSYWLVLLAAIGSGGLDEFALRLPSAIAALLTLWSTVALGRRLWSGQVGLLAGWILLTCFGFLQWGRLGEADMENLAATIGAVAWYWRTREQRNFSSYLVFYLIIAFGCMCKGLGAAVVPVLAIVPDVLRQRRWRAHINIAHAAAILLALGVYLLPFLVAASVAGNHATEAHASIGLQKVLRENIVRYFAPFDHTGPVYTYLIAIPQYLFPWTPVFLIALGAACTRKFRAVIHVDWLLWALALIFLFFTLSGSRRNYYILPILPYCALLSANYLLNRDLGRLRHWSINVSIALLLAFAATQAAVPLLWNWLQHRIGFSLPAEFKWISGLTGGITLGCYLWMYFRHRYQTYFGMAAIAGCAVIIWAGFFFWQQPALDKYRTEAQFAQDLNQLLEINGNAPAAIYREQPTGKLLFYAGFPQPLTVLRTADELAQFVSAPPRPKWVIAYKKYANELPAALRNRKPDVEEAQFAWEKGSGDKMQAWLLSGNSTLSNSPALEYHDDKSDSN